MFRASFVIALLTALACVGLVPAAHADDPLAVTSVSVGSGESPVTSGLSVSVDLKSQGGRFVQVMAQAEQAWLMAGRDWTFGRTSCSTYGMVGHFQAAPWVAPFLRCERALGTVAGRPVKAGAFAQPGVFLYREPLHWKNDGTTNPERFNTGFFEQAFVNAGGVTVSLSHLNFLDEPVNWLPGAAFSTHVRSDVEVSASVLWNKNADRAMYFIGTTWHPHH